MAKKLESNYDRNIFEQLYEALESVEKLQGEMRELKESHKKSLAELKGYEKARKEVTELRREIYIQNESHKKTVKELKETIKQQAAEIEQLKEENEALRGMVSKNSSNSSKPPSSDGYNKIQNSREPTGKKPGGQVGHKGHMPKLYEKPTKIIEIKAKKCECGGDVRYIEGKYAKKQFVDIEIKTNITEYREYKGVCDCCGSRVENHAPMRDIITYGDSLKSFVNMLSIEGNVSVNRIGQMLTEITGGLIKLSEGTICKWNRDLSKLLVPTIETIKEKLFVSPVLHKDETGIWVDKKLNWFHVLSNDKYSLYYADKKRGKDADTEAGLLPAFKGVLVHDNFKTLYHFTCTHAECNAHILRYLKGAVESKKRRWAKDMIEFLLKAKTTVEEKILSEAEILDYHRLYDEILDSGQLEYARSEKPNYRGEDATLWRRLKEYKTQHLLFLSDRTVPFDNNQAERDLRMVKAKTKISGCFRSIDGDSVFAVLKSYTSTLRKNGLNIFAALVSAWRAKPVLF